MTTCLLLVTLSLVPGERLEYDVKYGPLTLVTLALTTVATDPVEGESCWHLMAELEIARSVSWFFSARYDIESWCRKSDLATLWSYKRTEEPNYEAEWHAFFDTGRDSVYYTTGEQYPLPEGGRDLLSLWYWFRVAGLEPGEVRTVNGHIDRKNYRIRVTASGGRRVTTPAGRFNCTVVTPSGQSPFGTVYLADDGPRTPVIIRTRQAGLVVSAVLRRIAFEE